MAEEGKLRDGILISFRGRYMFVQNMYAELLALPPFWCSGSPGATVCTGMQPLKFDISAGPWSSMYGKLLALETFYKFIVMGVAPDTSPTLSAVPIASLLVASFPGVPILIWRWGEEERDLGKWNILLIFRVMVT